MQAWNLFDLSTTKQSSHRLLDLGKSNMQANAELIL